MHKVNEKEDDVKFGDVQGHSAAFRLKTTECMIRYRLEAGEKNHVLRASI